MWISEYNVGVEYLFKKCVTIYPDLAFNKNKNKHSSTFQLKPLKYISLWSEFKSMWFY